MSMEERPIEALDNAVPYLQQFRKDSRDVSEPFFSTPELRQRLDLLRHLTDNSEKILLVKGEDGAGKSTFLQQFRKQSRDEWDLCCMDASHTFQPDQFFAHLYRRFGLTDEGSLNIEQLLKRFELLAAAGRLPVIVIDDAHLLPVATIIAVFRLFERRPGNRALIRIVLFATPDIVRQFHTPQLQAMNLQSVQSLDLPLLDGDQSRSFVQFLLDLGDEAKHLKLGSGAMNRLVRDSAGLPGQLEAQLQRLFSSASKQPAQAVAATRADNKSTDNRGLLSDLPRPVLLGAGLLGVLLVLTLIFQDAINNLFISPSQEESVETSGQMDEKAIQPLQLPESPVQISRAPSSEVLTENQAVLNGVVETKEADLVLPNTHRQEEPQAGSEEVVDSASDRLLEKMVEPGPQDSVESVVPEQMVAPAQVADEGAPQQTEKPSGIIEIPVISEQPIQQDSKVVEAPAPPSKPENKPESVQKAVNVVLNAPQPAAGIRKEKWLMKQTPERYTLQLIGVRDERAVKSFIEQYRLKGDIAYFKTIRSGGAWYSVLYGVYPNREAAVKARSTLPAPLRKSDVWPRTFASVQAAIKSP